MSEPVLTADGTHREARPKPRADRGLARTAVVSFAWLVWAVAAQLMRGAGLRAGDVVWAEDASFLNHAIHRSLWENLATPHAGYLQVVFRLLAEPVATLPASWMALGMAAGASLIVALMSLVVWFTSATVLSSVWARMTVTALVPLLPQAGYEVNATGANLHWFLAYAAFWVFLAAPTSTRGRIIGSLVVLVAALSDPLTALVLPAAFVVAFLRRRRSFLVPAVLVVALAVQGAIHLTQPVLQWDQANPFDLPWIYGLRVLTSSVIGDRELGGFYDALGLPGVLLVSVLLAGLLFKLLTLARRDARAVALTAVSTSVLYLCVPLALRGTTGYLDSPLSLNGSRYTIVPLLLLWLAIIALADSVLAQRVGSTAPGLVPVAVTALLCLQLVADLGGTTVRSESHSWADDVGRAARTCAQPTANVEPQPVLAFAGPAGPDDVQILVGPTRETIPWGVVLPCSRLR